MFNRFMEEISEFLIKKGKVIYSMIS